MALRILSSRRSTSIISDRLFALRPCFVWQVENVYVQQETRIALTAQNLSAMIGSLCENVMDKVAAGKFPHDSPESITSLPNALAVVATFLAR